MKARVFLMASAAVLVVSGLAWAQAPKGPGPAVSEERRQMIEARREKARQHREEMLQRREELKDLRADLRQRRDQVGAERREMLTQFRDFQKDLHAQLKAGTLTREAATEQLRQWRKDHRPERPQVPPAASGSAN